MLADDAEIDEEIERQLEADAQDRNFLEQPLLNENELDVSHWSESFPSLDDRRASMPCSFSTTTRYNSSP